MTGEPLVLKAGDLEALIQGGCFFGSGGGGTLLSATNLLRHFEQDAAKPKAARFYPSHEVTVVSADDVHVGDSIVVAYLGAPARIADAEYPFGPINAVARAMARLPRGRQIRYIVPPESGALGFLVACLVAAKLGLQVIDGDGAGRAVPSLPMLTFAAECVSPSPAFLASQGKTEKDSLVVELDVAGAAACGDHDYQKNVATIVEHMMRPIVSEPQFGQFGGLAIWTMSPEELHAALPIKKTLSRALALGRAIAGREIATGDEMIAHLNKDHKHPRAFGLADGRLSSGSVQTSGGFDVGQIEITGSQGIKATCLYQNETLLAWRSDRDHPIAMAPDSIIYYLTLGTAEHQVASNGDLVDDKGQILRELKTAQVTVIGLVADPNLRKSKGTRDEGLILASFMGVARSMGYLGPYVPVERLQDQPREDRR
jgi:uncharacterized protein